MSKSLVACTEKYPTKTAILWERISLFYEVVLYKIDIFGLVGAQIFIENTDNKNFKLSFNLALLHKDLKCKAPLIELDLRRNLGKWST